MGAKRHETLLYKIAYLSSILLLVFNGAGAIYGGYGLITHPNGTTIGLDMKLLAHTPFTDYLVPGIALLLLNGICDFLVLVATVRKANSFHRYIVAQGMVLLIWLAIQILLIRTIDQMHFVMGLTGTLMIASGLAIMALQDKIDA